MYLKKRGVISTQNDSALKLLDKFTYLGSNISSTENDVNIGLKKVWNAIDRLSIIWKSDISDKTKRGFFQTVPVSILLEHMDIYKMHREKSRMGTTKENHVLF